MQSDEMEKKSSSVVSSNVDALPPTKKARGLKGLAQPATTTSSSSNSRGGILTSGPPDTLPSSAPTSADNLDAEMNSASSNWNMTNFKILTDCVNSIEELKQEVLMMSSNNNNAGSSKTGSSKTGSTSKFSSNSSDVSGDTPTGNDIKGGESSGGSRSNDGSNDEEDEYVCVVRTSDSCFVPYNRHMHKDLLMFSSGLSAASIEAHDFEMRNKARGSSPSDSNNSGNVQLHSDSSNLIKNSTSSEAGSEDNSGEVDSN